MQSINIPSVNTLGVINLSDFMLGVLAKCVIMLNVVAPKNQTSQKQQKQLSPFMEIGATTFCLTTFSTNTLHINKSVAQQRYLTIDTENSFDECQKLAQYAECRYDKCRCAECRGTMEIRFEDGSSEE